MADFNQILRALLSPDPSVRNPAEKAFEEARGSQPGATASGLFAALAQSSSEEPVREQAAVLLRQVLTKGGEESSGWSKFGEEQKQQCKAQLLQLLENEPLRKVRRKVADIVQSLGNQIITVPDGERPTNIQVWPELMPSLMRVIMDKSKDAGIRASMLWTVKELQVSIWQVMVANGQQTLQVIAACLQDPDSAVRAGAAVLFCEMLENIESKEERRPFGSLGEPFCVVLRQVAEDADNTYVKNVLQSLQSCGESIDFFKDQLGANLVPTVATVATSHCDEDTRRLALEAILSFAEAKPKLMAKVPGFFQRTIDIAVTFLMMLDDDVAEWAEQDGEEEEDENFKSGREAVDRLCRVMSKVDKFPQVMEVIKPVLAALFQAGEWKKVVAGVSVLSQIAEYIEDESTVLEMMSAIRAQLQAENPRVRHAAWSAVAQFSEDHSELVVGDHLGPQLLKDFLQGLDEQRPRVLERGMEAFQHFGEAVEREVLEPVLQPMMEKLGMLLQSPRRPVQSRVITYIAVIAGQVEDAFAPYYGPLMPLLKQLVQNVLHKTEERQLLGKLFECISLLANTVGPATFKADAESIMQAMIQATQVPDLPSNDPVKEYMMAASQRICSTMKVEFLPFVPHILPGVLEKLTLSPKEYDGQNVQDNEEVNLTLMEENGKVKVMIMTTSEMEDLQNALGCVHTLVSELAKHYAPFVAQTAQALLPVFDFSMSEDIRELAFETWGELCSAARNGGETQLLSQLFQEFLNRILPKLKDDDSRTFDVQALTTRADGVTACLKKAGPGVLSAEQVRYINDVALSVLEESFKRREAAASDKKKVKKPADDEDEDAQEEDDDDFDEGKLRIACCEIVGALMQHHADIFVAERLPQILALLATLFKSGAQEDNLLALFIVCDMLEHLKQRVTAQWPQFLPQLLAAIMHPDAKIRQPACYGASLAAQDPAFAQAAADSAQKLAEVVTKSRGRGKKKSEKQTQACADNALSALLEILTHHQAALAAVEKQLWGVWLGGLPCQLDEQEGVKNHRALLQLVERQKPEVLGEGGANLPQVLAVLVDVYKTDMADEETSKGIGKLILQVGDAKLEQMAGQLKEKQRVKLLRIHREAKAASA